MLGANSWRHVTFIEQERPLGRQEAGVAAGSLLQRLGVFEAGVSSTKDPRYVVLPQRQRLNEAKVV